MSKQTFGILTLLLGVAGILAAFAQPWLERWVKGEEKAISIQMIEPIQLSLLDKSGQISPFVTVLLIRNSGNQSLGAVTIPIRFSNVNLNRTARYQITTDPNFPAEIKPSKSEGVQLLTTDFLNRNDAINVSVITEQHPGTFITPRIRGTEVEVIKGALKYVKEPSAWSSLFMALLTFLSLGFLAVSRVRDNKAHKALLAQIGSFTTGLRQ